MKAPTFGIPEFTWRYPCVRALYNQDNAGSSVSVSLHGGKSKVSICFMKLRKPLRILRNIILFFFHFHLRYGSALPLSTGLRHTFDGDSQCAATIQRRKTALASHMGIVR